MLALTELFISLCVFLLPSGILHFLPVKLFSVSFSAFQLATNHLSFFFGWNCLYFTFIFERYFLGYRVLGKQLLSFQPFKDVIYFLASTVFVENWLSYYTVSLNKVCVHVCFNTSCFYSFLLWLFFSCFTMMYLLVAFFEFAHLGLIALLESVSLYLSSVFNSSDFLFKYSLC